MTQSLIISLDEVRQSDVASVGGKAATLVFPFPTASASPRQPFAWR